MAIITADYETHYSQEYSLRKMSTIDYILDPRFQTIMCAIKVNDGPTEAFIGHQAVAARLAQFEWSKCALLSHNTAFDGAILAWHYGIYPKMYLDTLSMARAITHAKIGRSSLAAVSDYMGLQAKGKTVNDAIGKRLEDMSPAFLREYSAYCHIDNDNCFEIFKRLRRVVPASELALIDTVIRMFTEPQVKLNPFVLAEHLHATQAELDACFGRVAHIEKTVFSSNPQFAALLEQHGVDVPKKMSPTTGLEMPALAKNDRAFKELCADESQPLMVQALLAARMASKSTIEITRTKKMADLSLREWSGKGQGWAPVPLKYWGAHTGRLSGDGGFNWQNFKRGSKIRQAIEAPPGYRVVHRDASQIEARMVAWLANCIVLINAFREGRDVYSEFASIIYNRRITKADKKERYVGKTSILGLGYQVGGEKLRHTLFIGNGGISVVVDVKTANDIVYTYRRTYPEIPALWQAAEWLLYDIVAMSRPIVFGNRMKKSHPIVEARPFPVVKAGLDAVWMPNDMCIAYPNLRRVSSRSPSGVMSNCFVYDSPYGEEKNIYGGATTENISQGLSRIIVTNTAQRIKENTGYHPFLSTHDSLDYCVPVSEAAAMDQILEAEFAVTPWWAPDLPLASEGGFGRNLAIAESESHPEHNT